MLTKIKTQVKRLYKDENGITTIEWIMLGVFLVVAMIGIVNSVKGTLGSTMEDIADSLSN